MSKGAHSAGAGHLERGARRKFVYAGCSPKRLPILCVLLTICFSCAVDYPFAKPSSADKQPDLPSLYDKHEWFQLRDAVQRSRAAAFYRGAVATAFNDEREAEKDLQQVIRAAPESERANNARGLLAEMHFRSGRYRHALTLVNQLLISKPDSANWKNTRPLLAALSGSPEQSVSRRGVSRVRYRREDGNMLIPVLVNGKSANFILDDGSNISTISESEAKRLGLTIHDFGGKATGASGQAQVRLALAESLTTGNFRLRHVAFLVLGDDQEPFAGLPAGERGIVGLPVLLAFSTLRWTADNVFEFGFRSIPGTLRQSNICFDGLTPMTEGQFGQARVILGLDMGAQQTDLLPNFARDFPNAIALGKRESTEITGYGRSKSIEAITVPEIKLRIGEFDAVLRPARVLLQQTMFDHRYYGNVGMDVFNQARMVTIDFQQMRLMMK